MGRIDAKIHFKTAIKSDPGTIYELITTSKGWDRWFTRGTVFILEKNGESQFSWKDWGADKVTETERAVVREFRPDEYLQFDWNHFLPEGPTTVELILTPRPGDTVLEVIQTGFHDTPSGLAMLSQCAAGWGEALTLLKFYVEHGISTH